MNRIRYNNIPYRKGYIEIDTNIHLGYINIEAWNIRCDFEMPIPGTKTFDLPDKAYDGDVELEISVDEAEDLIKLLRIAINKINSNTLEE